MSKFVFLFLISILMQSFAYCIMLGADFKTEQFRYPRVREAYSTTDSLLRFKFGKANSTYPPSKIFIRIFKMEKDLELWAMSKKDSCFRLIENYEICRMSGVPGPKRKEGDYQVPEGFYFVDRFNPASNYHLSLGINYPNTSDRKLGHSQRPGGDIFIHGNCVTIGCIPITDAKIKELYLAAVEAKDCGQIEIPVHIFPFKMTPQNMDSMSRRYKQHEIFWKNLKTGYMYFENKHVIPNVKVDKKGEYIYID